MQNAWGTLRPILRVAYELIGESPTGVIAGPALAERLGRDAGSPEWTRDIRALHAACYVGVFFDFTGPAVLWATEIGLQELAGWPGPRRELAAGQALLSLLEQAAADASLSEPQRAKARGLAGAARDVGTAVLSRVAADVVRQVSGL